LEFPNIVDVGSSGDLLISWLFNFDRTKINSPSFATLGKTSVNKFNFTVEVLFLYLLFIKINVKIFKNNTLKMHHL